MYEHVGLVQRNVKPFQRSGTTDPGGRGGGGGTTMGDGGCHIHLKVFSLFVYYLIFHSTSEFKNLD